MSYYSPKLHRSKKKVPLQYVRTFSHCTKKKVLTVVVVVFIDQSEDKAMGPRHRLPLVTLVGVTFVTARQAQGDQGRGRGGTEGEEDSYENRLRSLSAH